MRNLIFIIIINLFVMNGASAENIIASGVKLQANDTVSSIKNFKINEMLGTWFEIARLPIDFENRCLAPIKVNYTLQHDQILINRTCPNVSGAEQVTEGVIYLSSANLNGNGELISSLMPTWLRWTYFGRNSVAVIYQDKDLLLLGSPSKKNLWLFSRDELPPLNDVQNMIAIAGSQGFLIKDIIFNYPNYYPR